MPNASKNTNSIILANQIIEYLSDNQLPKNLTDISYEILALQLLDSLEQSADLQTLKSEFESTSTLTLASHINTQTANFTNSKSSDFDPIKAILSLHHSDYDEACWLSFLLIYTDDSAKTDWAFMRLLYSGLGLGLSTQNPQKLTWQALNNTPELLGIRLDSLSDALASHHPKPKFGHHRAYESFNHLPAVFNSYISFVNKQGGHKALFKPVSIDNIDNNDKKHSGQTGRSKEERQQAFNTLYILIRQNVYRFGRLSTFEFLGLLGKTGLADIEPDSCYIADASGPKRGAKLLFGMLGNHALDDHAKELAHELDMGYQEVEEALCHWQKSPNRYIAHNENVVIDREGTNNE